MRKILLLLTGMVFCTFCTAAENAFKAALTSGNRNIAVTMPDYPEDALKRGIVGTVLFEFSLDVRGAPKNVAIIKSEPAGIFDEAVKKAIASWHYLPNMQLPCSVSERRSQQQIWFEIQDGEPRISMSKVADLPDLVPVLRPMPELGKGAYIDPGTSDDNRLVLVKNTGLVLKNKESLGIMYPKSARVKGLQGFVVVNFKITADGEAVEPTIVYSIPYDTFDITVQKAVAKFEFANKDGKPPGRSFKVCQEFTFLLED